jgi:hypothetical protein
MKRPYHRKSEVALLADFEVVIQNEFENDNML